VLAIHATGEGERELIALRWGRVPSWSKGPDSRYSMINARAETVQSKPAYRNAFKRRRCLIPAEGFYEWKTGAHGKTPFLIQRQNRLPFAMAGLWERWHGAGATVIESCTIVVTDANDLVHEIRDGMPVILGRDDHGPWLDPGNTNSEGLIGMLRPVSPGAREIHPVSQRVNSPRNDAVELLEAVDSIYVHTAVETSDPHEATMTCTLDRCTKAQSHCLQPGQRPGVQDRSVGTPARCALSAGRGLGARRSSQPAR
jgi:putative SOS response-associated peptidase YedK